MFALLLLLLLLVQHIAKMSLCCDPVWYLLF